MADGLFGVLRVRVLCICLPTSVQQPAGELSKLWLAGTQLLFIRSKAPKPKCVLMNDLVSCIAGELCLMDLSSKLTWIGQRFYGHGRGELPTTAGRVWSSTSRILKLCFGRCLLHAMN